MPSGVWDAEEYAKLAQYDGETFAQLPNLFACHQSDGRLCAGWVGCHDMEQSLALRIAATIGSLDAEVVDEVLDYTTTVPLFASGADAAAHGMAEVSSPGVKALRVIDKVRPKVQQAR